MKKKISSFICLHFLLNNRSWKMWSMLTAALFSVDIDHRQCQHPYLQRFSSHLQKDSFTKFALRVNTSRWIPTFYALAWLKLEFDHVWCASMANLEAGPQCACICFTQYNLLMTSKRKTTKEVSQPNPSSRTQNLCC